MKHTVPIFIEVTTLRGTRMELRVVLSNVRKLNSAFRKATGQPIVFRFPYSNGRKGVHNVKAYI